MSFNSQLGEAGSKDVKVQFSCHVDWNDNL